MATATISGTITIPTATGGPNVSMVLGSPSITPSSSTGPTLTFNEKSANTYGVTTAASPVTIPMGTISDGDLVYLGTDQPVTVIFNGGAESFSLPIGGFMLFYKASITAIQVTATLMDAVVEVLIAGD